MKTVTIKKWGNSQGIIIPKYILNDLNWKDNEEVDISTKSNQIIITKSIKNKRKNIKELFAGFDGKYVKTEINWGKPVGKEVW